MAFVTSPISLYKVVRYGKRAGSELGAYIHCYHNNQNVMSCVFWNDENNVPENHQNPGQRVQLNYPISALTEILNILQNEKPLYFGFIDSTKVGYVSTHTEPVGEEES